MDSDIDVGSVGFLSLDSFNVNNELFAVHLHNFTDLVAFVMSADDLKEKLSRIKITSKEFDQNKLKGVN